MTTQRQRWMADRIRETFKEVPDKDIEAFMQSQGVVSHTKSLFNPTGPVKLFVFQEESKDNTPSLKVSTGADEHLTGKCCYFLRSAQEGKAVDPSKVCDADLSFGTLNNVPLKTLELLLNQLYKPLVDGQDQLGKADVGQTNEFKSEMGHFIGDLQEMLSSMSSGLELRKPETLYDGFTPADQKLVSEHQELLDEWCKTIEEYLSSGDKVVNGFASSDTSQGPLTELEYWRKRMQRLTSITEQVKSKECRSVIQVLSALAKGPNLKDPSTASDDRQNVFALLRRWKQLDISITESANEAKDNVKYLFTLEKFIEPLYSGTPVSIIDTIPALMNSIKMIHTIARYYNTTERMTGLFAKVTNQMIENCKFCINEGDSHDQLWAKDPEELVRRLEACLKLNEAYQDQYRITKDKLLAMPKGKQFDFNEAHIFGKFDLFCRRVIKLIDMFSTIHQFISLGDNQLEGMESLINGFQGIIRDFKLKNHDLLDFHNNKFDRDYVEFNVKISDLETQLQNFINESFESITSIEQSLNLLRKFQSILQRENLKSDVDSKFNVIFQNYGFELEQVQKLYEAQKHSPPIPRNLPPVAGNIKWSRHLLKRIEDPMKRFESNQNVLASKDAKRIIRLYNKVARTLVAFEYLWYQAWVQSIETAKAGLQATLIIRHPEDNKLYVNFDQEILQLIREAKTLDRMGIDVPESARIVLLQENKFKAYYNNLQYTLSEYDRIVAKVIPVTAMLLRPHFNDMEFKLRPGMTTLTWTSMNIDAYKSHVYTGLHRLEQLVHNINDIIENRIEKNLKQVSKTVLVNLPSDRSYTLEEFVAMQEEHIAVQAASLQDKNVEIEHAVDDLLKTIQLYQLDSHIEPVSDEEAIKLKRHYNHFMYQALLHCSKNSLNAIKGRVASRLKTTFLYVKKPFF